VQCLGSGPGNGALVRDSENDSILIFQHEGFL
jgi:hypothetical protein